MRIHNEKLDTEVVQVYIVYTQRIVSVGKPNSIRKLSTGWFHFFSSYSGHGNLMETSGN
jgi:hypothetical protein